jgi:tetratricopeptide (TPR) repeat protein
MTTIFHWLFTESDWGSLNILKVPILKEAIKYPKLLYPFLIFQVLILTVWFLREKKNTIRVLLSVIFLFEFSALFQTQTRGAIVGFIASIVFLSLVCLFLPQINKRIKKATLTLLILILISPFILVANKDSDFIQSNDTLRRLATISLTDLTTESRLLTWNASWRGWKETSKSFLIGYGPENYYYAFSKYFPVKIYKDRGSRIWFDRAHNIIFDIGVTTGILGLITYLSILGLAVWTLFKKARSSQPFSSTWLLIGLFIAYFIQNFFVFDTLNTEIPFYLVLGFVTFLTIPQKKEEKEVLPEKSVNYIYVSVLIVILLFGLAINIKTLRANKHIFKALVSERTNISNAFEHFKKAINESVVSRSEARQQLANYVAGLAKSGAVPSDRLKPMVDYTIGELRKSIAEEPLSVRQYIYLSSFYNATAMFNPNSPQLVIDLMEEIIELSPTRPQIYYEIAQAYTLLGNFDQTKRYFEKGLSLAPKVIDDRWNLLTVYLLFGRYDLAEAQFKLMKEELDWTPRVDDYQRIISLYERLPNRPEVKPNFILEVESSLRELGTD